MDANDHCRIMTELETLRRQVVNTIHRFESTGVTALMKEDYVALHALEHRIMEMYREHKHAIDVLEP